MSCIIKHLEKNCLQEKKGHNYIFRWLPVSKEEHHFILRVKLFSKKYEVQVEQKYLDKGHTQMECDFIHIGIESCLKNKEIYMPSDYLKITNLAPIKNPYLLKSTDNDFFQKLRR